MSFGTDVKTKFKNLDFTDFVSAELLGRVREEVIEKEIKSSIAVGLSPVAGFSRFVGYANPDKYPGDKKGSRPVNLELTGEMLDNYDVESASDKSINIGILSSAPAEVIARAEGNNFGTAKGVAARRFVPGPGEIYKQNVMVRIRQIFADRIVELIDGEE